MSQPYPIYLILGSQNLILLSVSTLYELPPGIRNLNEFLIIFSLILNLFDKSINIQACGSIPILKQIISTEKDDTIVAS